GRRLAQPPGRANHGGPRGRTRQRPRAGPRARLLDRDRAEGTRGGQRAGPPGHARSGLKTTYPGGETMNTSGLAKQDSQLAPRERFVLFLAAAARGDEWERTRLLLCGPRKQFSASDHYGVALSFSWLSDYHFTEVLNLAACYFEAFAELRRTCTTDGDEAWD